MAAAQGLSEEVALRIGLASRQLAGTVGLGDLIGILFRAVGRPLSHQRLSRLRIKRLREAGRGVFDALDDEQLRQVLILLRGQGMAATQVLPACDPWQEGDMPGSIRVACSSNRSDRVDGPFGNCERYLIYQVSAQEVRLVDIRQPTVAEQKDERYSLRVNLLSDCHVLVALTIGGPVAACLVRAGLHPIRLGVPRAAPDVMAELQQVLDSSPAPWLLKIMEASARQAWNRQQALSQEMTT